MVLFTTVVNMDNIVNKIAQMQTDIQSSCVFLWIEGEYLHLKGPAGAFSLRLVRLYRPSSEDIQREAGPNVILILTAAHSKAFAVAQRYNHIFLPHGGYRIVAPGIALINTQPHIPSEESRQVRLMGRTGVLAETLLLGGQKKWSVRELAESARVSPALAHRVVTRLEREHILTSDGYAREKTRILSNSQALAELWSQEEKIPKPFLRGFLYGASVEAVAQKVLAACPDSAVGGVLAANLYRPTLTQVPPPLHIWVPSDFNPEALTTLGFEQTETGVNIEFTQVKNNSWQVYRSLDNLPKVSQWRAWLEIAKIKGRVEELAEALRSKLEQNYAEGT